MSKYTFDSVGGTLADPDVKEFINGGSLIRDCASDDDATCHGAVSWTYRNSIPEPIKERWDEDTLYAAIESVAIDKYDGN
jgi:hypothetical protein